MEESKPSFWEYWSCSPGLFLPGKTHLRRNPLQIKTLTSIEPALPKAVESSLAQFASEEVSLGEDKISFIPQRAAVKEIKFSKYQDYVFEINGLFLEA
jgi:hypothetical protein